MDLLSSQSTGTLLDNLLHLVREATPDRLTQKIVEIVIVIAATAPGNEVRTEEVFRASGPDAWTLAEDAFSFSERQLAIPREGWQPGTTRTLLAPQGAFQMFARVRPRAA